jgi:hypothetical protein
MRNDSSAARVACCCSADSVLSGKETYEFAKPVLSSVNDLKAAVIHKAETYGEFRFGVTRGIGELALKRPIEHGGGIHPSGLLRTRTRFLVSKSNTDEMRVHRYKSARQADYFWIARDSTGIRTQPIRVANPIACGR